MEGAMRTLFALVALAATLPTLASIAWAGPVTIELEGGKELVAASVGPWSADYVVATKPDGTREFVMMAKIRAIRDDEGHDLTKAVLSKRQKVVGDSLDIPDVLHESQLVARPLPERRWFFVTQAGMLARLDTGSDLYDKSGGYVVLDYGAVKNLNPRFGVGGNLRFGIDDRRSRFGVKARLRTWLSRDVGIDLAPGILLAGTDDWIGDADFPGLVGEASASFGGWLQLVGEVESVHIQSESGLEDQDVSWMAGVRLGGVPGVAATVGALVVGMGFLVIAAGLGGL
jgi:hypothetical protein